MAHTSAVSKVGEFSKPWLSSLKHSHRACGDAYGLKKLIVRFENSFDMPLLNVCKLIVRFDFFWYHYYNIMNKDISLSKTSLPVSSKSSYTSHCRTKIYLCRAEDELEDKDISCRRQACLSSQKARIPRAGEYSLWRVRRRTPRSNIGQFLSTMKIGTVRFRTVSSQQPSIFNQCYHEESLTQGVDRLSLCRRSTASFGRGMAPSSTSWRW